MSIKRLETAAAPPERGLTDLSIIGVPSSQFTRMPGVAGFPQKFSRESQAVWNKLVMDEAFKKRCKVAPSNDLMWHNAIQEFLSLCEHEGVFPFQNNPDLTRNEFVHDYVKRGRIALVKFLDETGIFDRVKVKKAYREYLRKDKGLVITSWAELYPVKDAEGFLKWAQQVPMPRFIKSVDSRYIKVVQPNVHTWIRYINSSRIYIGFSIEVPGVITIPGKPNPRRKDVDNYIDDFLFLPIIRAHRFHSVKTRLF